MASFHDEFSRQAAAYTQFRPTYPKALFEYLSSVVPAREAAWDAGTGNGQSAVVLADYFESIRASDPSTEQLRHAKPHARVHYYVGAAEESGLGAASVDLVTVAQAAHWFDFSRFIPEVKRVLRPRGVIALWGYAFHRDADPEIDTLLNKFGKGILKDYWSPQPKLLWNNYDDLPFPFRKLAPPNFMLEVTWSLPELIGYWTSWSSTQKFLDANGYHPVRDIYPRLEAAWGGEGAKRTLSCPLALKVGVAD